MTCDPRLMPTLVLVRHGKSEAHRTDDHSRELAARGRADAAAVREWLTQKGISPDRVVVSTAERTRQTWQLASVGDAPAVYEHRVYEASVEDLLDVLRETPAEVQTLVLVGHNPAVERLAWQLDDSEAARDQTDKGMPTSAVAVFEVRGWSDLSAGELQELVAPRG
ncbi:MAG: putative phosphohistidine phosphatase, SixA [Frankiales bacterium]|nr:putative phosphohistidine phosphatase, SixA [Frankiales bacterium]